MAACFRVILVVTYLLFPLKLYETVNGDYNGDHYSNRIKIIGKESLMSLGGSIKLTDNEEALNDILMKYKIKDLDAGFDDASQYFGSKHFFRSKEFISGTRVFKIIKNMPKGAALHIHDTGLVDVNYVVKNITYRNNLYMCYIKNKVSFKFMTRRQSENSNVCRWVLVSEVRASSGNVDKFDKDLAKHFTMWTDDPESAYPDIDAAWDKFGECFSVLFPMLTYEPVWNDYFYEALRQFHEDNVMYIEIRSVLPNLYDFNRTYGTIHTAEMLRNTVEKFKENYPDFYGAKLIYAPPRKVGNIELNLYLDTANILLNRMPQFFAGFDLVGREDSTPLINFVDQLTNIRNMSVFYHSGETNWYGTNTDYNLIDAVLLGAKRLGHAYALLKHPKVCDIVRNRKIAIEVNPISNQVLKLGGDFRNHPLASMIANNYPVVVSSDDPGLWGALPLSHDFYITFNFIASRHADLRLLKQLVFNSITYSSLSDLQRINALMTLNLRWTDFINKALLEHSRNSDST